ncbi:DUF975 family protein [Clostridium sp. B9]|uniref:DUF975 family protein n=1 Tax=Clostridium sp. B9 TaxID=3423224 RepID=UPI003D2F33BC
MTRIEIKSLAEKKLKRRWTNFVLLTLIIGLVQGIVTFGINELSGGIIGSILSLANTFLLAPFFSAVAVVYTIKFVDSDEKVSMKEGLPSRKVWISFIKNTLVLILFELPIFIISIIIMIAPIYNYITSTLYSTLFTQSMNEFDLVMNLLGTFVVSILIVVIIVAIYSIILGLYFLPVQYLIAEDENLGIWDAVAKAFKMMKGHKWEFFLLELSLIGWAILSVITLGIGLLWFIPYKRTVYRIFYLSISGNNIENKDSKKNIDKDEFDFTLNLDKQHEDEVLVETIEVTEKANSKENLESQKVDMDSLKVEKVDIKEDEFRIE